jgi:hypothetical protein
MATTAAILGGIQTVSSFASQQSQAGAITKQADFNTDVANLQATDAAARGDFDAGQRGILGRQTIGAQRANAAGSGVDVNSGSAAQLQENEARLSAMDQLTIKNNANRQAWGFRTQAALDHQAADNQAANIKAQSYSTLINGFTNSYGIYSQGRNSSTVPTSTKPLTIQKSTPGMD